MLREEELVLYKDIGFGGLTHKQLNETLNFLYNEGVSRVILRMLSRGGDPEESWRIVEVINKYQTLGMDFVGINDLYVASAGMNVLLSCDYVFGLPDSQYLIHNVWTTISGSAKQLREVADVLEDSTTPSIDLYVKKSRLTRDEVIELMDRDEWMSLDDALKNGMVAFKYNGAIDVNKAESYLNYQIHNNIGSDEGNQLSQCLKAKIEEV